MEDRQNSKPSIPFIPIIAFLIGIGVVLNFVVPPFQNPDEPVHFGAIMTYALGEEEYQDIQAEIIRIMDENNWWRFVGMGRPAVLPDSMASIGYLMNYLPEKDLRFKLNNLVLYHAALGRIVRFIPGGILPAYYFCRFLSYLFFLGSLGFIYLSLGKFSNSNGILFSYGVLFVLLLPQSLIMSLSVNSDSFSIFLASVFFYGVSGLLVDKIRASYAALILLTAGIGFFTKKSTFFLIIMAVSTPVFLISKKNYKNIVVFFLAMVLAAMLGAILLVNLFPVQFENSVALVKRFFLQRISQFPQMFSFNEFNRAFFLRLSDSFLLKFGWMAYDAHPLFYSIWRILILLSGAGIVIYLCRTAFQKIKRSKGSLKQSATTRMAVFSLAAIFIQVTGFWVFYGTSSHHVQGRYLFPVLIPIVFLFVLGMTTIFKLLPPKAGAAALGSLVVFEFLFISFVVWNYLVPVFHLTLNAPHPGI